MRTRYRQRPIAHGKADPLRRAGANIPGRQHVHRYAVPLQVRVRGRYPQIRALVQGLDDSPRLVVVDRLALTGTEGGIAAEFSLRALYAR